MLPVPDAPSLAEGVNDPVFAYLIGLHDRGIFGAVSRDHFDRATQQAGRRSRIPFELITGVVRAPGRQAGTGWVRMTFTGPLDVPVPYSLLGYHPGSLLGSPVVTLEEWQIGRTLVANVGEGDPVLELEDLTLWGIVAGEVWIDIDGWVDRLMGGRVDDTFVVGLAIFRFQGARLAMALGFNRDGEGRSGALDLQADRLRFPAPPALKVIGRDLRGRVIQRLARRGIPAWLPPNGDPARRR
jgi:hypothetical protein